MKKIIELPQIEKWNSDNGCLYFTDYDNAIVGENGSYDFITYRMPHPIPQVFYKRRKIPLDMLNDPQYNNCKYCDEPLYDGYWRRMHMCRKCYLEEPWKNPLFECSLSKDSSLEK